jgi:hypothetical protein
MRVLPGNTFEDSKHVPGQKPESDAVPGLLMDVLRGS